MVHVLEKKEEGFSAKIIGFVKNDPIIKPFFPNEDEEGHQIKEKIDPSDL
jgi:hypothetical protein